MHTNSTKHKISVITISLNSDRYIEKTIQSVLNQTYDNIEYIIIDGQSTDNTLNIINKYKEHINHFISEKDDGIADAMNKGVALATGDYVVFIHSDDYFYDNKSLELALEYIDEDTDILACNILFGKKSIIRKAKGFCFLTNFKQRIHHQGTLCHNSLFLKLNGFDKQFKIAMDYDFFLRAYRGRYKLVKAPVILSVMRDTGISSRQDWHGLKQRFDEEKRVHEKNCPSYLMSMIYKAYWFLYLPYRYMLQKK